MERTFRTCDMILSFAGIRIFSSKKWNSKMWLLLQIICFLIGILALIFTTGFIVINVSETVVLLKGASIWSTCIILSISLTILLFYKNKFREFLVEMASVDFMLEMPLIKLSLETEKPKSKLNELKDLVITTRGNLMKFIRILMQTYAFIVFFNSNLYLFDAVFRMIARKDPDERLFGYDMWFPWSTREWKAYIPTFIFHAHAGFLCSIAFPGLQVSIALLVREVLRQMRILAHVLRNIDQLSLEIVNDTDNWQTQCTEILNQCVVHYIKLKRIMNRLNIICRPFYLTLILDSIIVVCMCSVKVAISDKLAVDTLKYYPLGLSFIIIVFAFCFLGQMVETECNNLEKAVNEKWYIYDAKHKTHVKIFNIALRHGMPIYIFGTIPLSLPTFTWFLKTMMSFFTLMMSVLEK